VCDRPNMITFARHEPTTAIVVAHTAHTCRMTTPHTRRLTGQKCATTRHTPAQETDGHVRNTQPCGKSEGACTQQPRVDLREKSNNEDHCIHQEHVYAQESNEEGNSAQRRQMLVSDAPHGDNIIRTDSSTDVHISCTNVSPTTTF